MTSAKIALYRKELTARGIAYEDHSQGDTEYIVFRWHDLSFVLPAEPNDPTFFQLLLPGVYEASTPEERQRVLDVANDMSRSRKVVKVYMADSGHVSLSIEMLLDPVDACRPVFERCLRCLFETWMLLMARLMDKRLVRAA